MARRQHERTQEVPHQEGRHRRGHRRARRTASAGKVLRVLASEERIVVERVNFIKRHVRPSKKTPQGGVIEREASMHISNVKLVCPSCSQAVRVGVRMRGRRQGPLLQEVQRPGG